MSGINEIRLIGRVGKDPEDKSTVVKFTLAVNDGYGDKAKTEWFNVSCFKKTGEAVMKYVKKGAQVYVAGSMSSFKNDKGNTLWGVTAKQVLFLDSKKSEPEIAAKPEGYVSFEDDDVDF